MDHHDDQDLDLSDEEGYAKKRKIIQACDACRKKKIKCDGQDNKECSSCATKKVECVYTPTSTKRGPRQGYIETLEKRLELMEKLLQPLKNIELRSFPTPTSGMAENQFSDEYALSRNRGSLSSDGLCIMPQSNARSGESPNFGDIEQYLLNESSLVFPSIPSPPTPPIPVISPEVSEHLISLYFTYQHPLLPIIHRATFLNSFNDNKQCALLLFTIYALASRFSSHPEVCKDPCYSSGEEYITHAKILLESSSYSTPSLPTVQALVLMSLHEFGCNRYPTAWMYSGLAVRMGQHLNLYSIDKKDNKTRFSWVEMETRRRTWFGCCLMDRFISTKTSWPMAIHDEDCNVHLPGDDFKWENSPAATEDGNNPLFHQESSLFSVPEHMYYFGSLVGLMGQVNHYTNRSTQAKESSGFKVDSETLDEMLQTWLNSLPAHLRYSPELFDSQTPEAQMASGAVALLHCLFHTIVIVLHRSNIGRFLNDMTPVDDNHMSAVRCVHSASFITTLSQDVSTHRFIQFVPFYSFALYEAGSIHANRAFCLDPHQAAQSRNELEFIYRTLLSLETYWGICKTYCTSLRGLYALRSSRETISSNSQEGLASTVMSWLVPLKSSFHEWYPYLEKLSKGLDHDFCQIKPSSCVSPHNEVPSNQYMNAFHNGPEIVSQASGVPSLNQGVFEANLLNSGSTGQPLNEASLTNVLGFNPDEALFNNTFDPSAFNYDFGNTNNFMATLNEEAFFNMNLDGSTDAISNQPPASQFQPTDQMPFTSYGMSQQTYPK
ncbi:hypothetical protein DSO57_1004006 [Entomophthora muscae]|uniref:Uncharacterized protein n=1 Tax=Entomophthora muscae TaxID=34485 RepID=A0ACC2SLC7_9FUNG|nr:hypothetical protein DSO57_1004006 [Entomophthora muscae]